MNDILKGWIHFIGCGGVGMVGLAKIAFESGARVSGSDMRVSENTKMLEALGVPVRIGHENAELADPLPNLVVRSSAVADDNPELAGFAAAGVPSMRRGEFLARIAERYETTVAIAGSHGKTSVTALITHILKRGGVALGYMIGGKLASARNAGYGDFVAPASAGEGMSLFITESDESDGTQVFLSPTILVVTNIEDDHSWSVGGREALFANFAEIASNSKYVIAYDSESTRSILGGHPSVRFLDPGVVRSDSGGVADFRDLNANIAVECAVMLGVEKEEARRAALSFPGVSRRMTIHIDDSGFMLIEDYAHHPTEVRSALSAIRSMAPDNYLKVVFQPHRYARLAKYLDDFARELREGADEVVIAPVFAAWTETGEVDSTNLADAIGEKASLCSSNWSETAPALLAESRAGETLAVLGAGDIDGLVDEIVVCRWANRES